VNTQEIEAQIAQAEAQLAALTGTGLSDVQVACCLGLVPSRTQLVTWLKDLGLTIIGEVTVHVHRDPRAAVLVSVSTQRPLPAGWVLVELETLAGTSTYWTHKQLNGMYREWLAAR
jgi:hypothetical protein